MEEKEWFSNIKLENWRNLFKIDNWKSEIIWIIIILLLVYSYWGYKKDMEICFVIANDPCPYCFAQQENERARMGGINITKDIPYEFKEDDSQLNAT